MITFIHTNGMLRSEEIMARNKHPEQTANLILDVAFRLFMEKGYEHTSIQDIIDNLGGLTVSICARPLGSALYGALFEICRGL